MDVLREENVNIVLENIRLRFMTIILLSCTMTYYTRKEIPVSKEEILRSEWIKSWSHLHRIVNDVPVFLPDVEIGLLIGSNCLKANEPKDFIVGDHGGPFAVKTFAG